MSADAFNVAVNIHSTALIKTANSFMLWPIWLHECVHISTSFKQVSFKCRFSTLVPCVLLLNLSAVDSACSGV